MYKRQALGLHALQHRGQEGCGIVSYDGKNYHSEKRFGLVGDNFNKEKILKKYEKEGHPFYASARLWDDGIISPVDTRAVLIKALHAVKNNPSPDPKFPVFRM